MTSTTYPPLNARRAAVVATLARYGQMPDVEDRIGDALEALTTGWLNFNPQGKYNGFAYQLRYALGQVAGITRRRAQEVKEMSAAEVTATDAGVEELFYNGSEGDTSLLGPGRAWIVKGHIVTESELLAEAADPGALKEALDALAAEDIYAPKHDEDIEPAFLFEVPGREPLFRSDVENADEVVAASRGVVPWIDGFEEWYEVREDEASKMRPVNAMSRDEHSWHEDVLEAWSAARQAWRGVFDPTDLLNVLAGNNAVLGENDSIALLAMYSLSEAILDTTGDDNFDSVGRSAARSLAEYIVRDGLTWKPDQGSSTDALRVAFTDFFGAEPDADSQVTPDAVVLRKQVEDWLGQIKMWPSQRAEIEALLDGATPWEARKVGKAVFKASRRR